jgi:hypothetical protein
MPPKPKGKDDKKKGDEPPADDGQERELVEKELVIGYLKSKLGRCVSRSSPRMEAWQCQRKHEEPMQQWQRQWTGTAAEAGSQEDACAGKCCAQQEGHSSPKRLCLPPLSHRRYQEFGDKLQVDNIKLNEELETQKLNLRDINEFLTNELKARSLTTSALEAKVYELNQLMEDVKKNHEVRAHATCPCMHASMRPALTTERCHARCRTGRDVQAGKGEGRSD